ncbi:hypothetical protein YC2023_095413 [Brassica napus]
MIKSQSKSKHNNKNNDVYLIPDMKSYKRSDVCRGKKLIARGGSSLGGLPLLFVYKSMIIHRNLS